MTNEEFEKIEAEVKKHLEPPNFHYWKKSYLNGKIGYNYIAFPDINPYLITQEYLRHTTRSDLVDKLVLLIKQEKLSFENIYISQMNNKRFLQAQE